MGMCVTYRVILVLKGVKTFLILHRKDMETADRLFGREGTPDLNSQMACEAPFHTFLRDNTSVFDNFLFPGSFSGLQGNLIKITFLVPLAHFSHLVKSRYLYWLLSENSSRYVCFLQSVFSPPLLQADIDSSISAWKSDVNKEDANLVK